jgi:hypothetical protein
VNIKNEALMDARNYAATHTLKNGAEITIRAIRIDDKWKLLEAFKELDQSSIYTRFFGHKKSLSEAELEQATNLDFGSTVALVATTGHGEEEVIVGGGRYSTVVTGFSPRSAEVALTVEEDYQARHHKTALRSSCSNCARVALSRLQADVLAVHQPMACPCTSVPKVRWFIAFALDSKEPVQPGIGKLLRSTPAPIGPSMPAVGERAWSASGVVTDC